MLTTLLLTLAISVSCPADDAPCLRRSLLAQAEEIDRLKYGIDLAKQIIVEERARADRWKETADKVAPKPPSWYQTPGFWLIVGLGTGFVTGALVTVGTTAAVSGVVNR